MKLKGGVIFRQYIPKKRTHSSIKIYKLCNESGYTYDMRVYLGTDSHSATDNMTAAHKTVRHLTSRVEGSGHNIFMDNFFSSPGFFVTWTVKQTEDTPHKFGPKQLKLKMGDIRVRSRGGLTALVWKDK